ncbi:MAG: hypothetical protein IKP31_00590 [Lachnospiraceae bacterium]|nr:hypothetical protein [Lachnospiraceae bacterium]
MGFLKNISVRIKLLILTVPLAIALMIACVVIGVEMNSVEDEVATVYYNILYDVNSKLVNGDRDFYQAIYAATQYYDIANGYSDAPEEMIPEYLQTNIDDYENNCAQVVERVEGALESAKQNSVLLNEIKAEDGNTFASAEENFMNYYNEWRGMYDLKSGTGSWDGFINGFRSARDMLDDMQEITETWAEKEHQAISNEITQKIVMLSVIFGVLIVILIIIAIMIIRGIRAGVGSATENLKELAAGNLAVQLPDDESLGKDEIGQMQLATSTLTRKLRDIMGRSNAMAREVSSAGNELASSSDQASQASGQVTVAVDEISQGAVSQAESVEHAAGNTNDIGNDIEIIAGNVEQLDSYAESMKINCDEAMDALNKLLSQSREVQESVREIGQTIDSTNGSAKDIHNFVAAITAIASQTNLLSLNASIEAARAGEAGRGFAVVAEEIAALAEQSNQSAQEIGRIVDQLLQDASASVDVMARLNESFESQSVQMEATRDNMESMAQGVVSVAESADAIAAKIEGLTGAKDTLVGIVSDLSAISEENAASTEETNASMQELNATFSIINDSANNLQGLARELQDIISYFKS